MKKTNKNMSMGIAMGMCIGVAIGAAFDNTSMGTTLGMCIGMAIGFVIGTQKDKEVNKQLEEQGYTIQTIERNEQNKEYLITIVNKWGEESNVVVPEGQMDEEEFEIGDVVFLDDDGLIEQAYDKEDE